MDRSQKQDYVSEFRDTLEVQGLVVITQQSGLSAGETNELRRIMRESETSYRIGKNTLLRLAVEGTKYAGLKDLFKGPTAVAYSLDPVAAAKAVVTFAKKNDKLQVVGAALGEKVLTAQQVHDLASLPSLDQLRGKLVGLLLAPATKVAGIAQAPAGQLARVIQAYSQKS